ncbi:tripartite motif-containing protein 44 isoform X2 [Corythoichthys intestinalis]|uniref:tripartite motif-containing protein 44 isoform X2 n=1 Tax=Corythoichthys intestinalis TaxID=161448 RepID=UPI0025A6668C|nr:tripartite motif-containing protein 44 isoform X2 [Corythoichthys intestinalis]
MEHYREPMEGVMEMEVLPQMDGTCDACEPDEPLLATQVCHTCSFAFCCLHADRHASSTHHLLTPFNHEGTYAKGNNSNINSGIGAEEDSLKRLPNEQNVSLRQAAIEDENGEDMNGHESKNHLLPQGAELGAKCLQDGQKDMAVKEDVKRDTVTVERLRCKEHGQDGTLYCKQDEKIICVVCAVQGEHQGHEIITLHDAYKWQKNRQGRDLLDCTQKMEEQLSNKWTNPEMSALELEAFVSSQFEMLHRLVNLEEQKTLHLLDLKEASLTASAAEKIAEINVQTERLQEEVANITHQLYLLDRATIAPVLAVETLADASGAGHSLTHDFESRRRISALAKRKMAIVKPFQLYSSDRLLYRA